MNQPSIDYRHLTPVPPEPQSQDDLPYRREGKLFLPETASLPLQHCICCGRPALKTVKKAIRNPRDPRTWYTRQRVIEIGLCKKHAEDSSVAIALTCSLMAAGLLLAVTGALTMSIETIVIGVLIALISGVFRAGKPISSPAPGLGDVELNGVAESYVRQFPEEAEV
jgi:hypothetical protein